MVSAQCTYVHWLTNRHKQYQIHCSYLKITRCPQYEHLFLRLLIFSLCGTLLTFLFLFGGVSRRILNCHLLTEAGVKSEDKENKAASSKDTRSLSLLHDVPALHLAAVRQRHDRANLLKNVGPFRRGLCARRDLEIRRQLCKVDKVGCNCVPAFLKV